VAGSPDGQPLAYGSVCGELSIRDVATGRLEASIPGRDQEVRALGWSPDGRVLAAGNWVDGIDLYDTATWQRMDRLPDRDRPEIYGPLPFSPDGTALAVGLADGSTTIWDVARRQTRTVPPMKESIAVDGFRIANGYQERWLNLLQIRTPHSPIRFFHTRRRPARRSVFGAGLPTPPECRKLRVCPGRSPSPLTGAPGTDSKNRRTDAHDRHHVLCLL
jgi:WD40 repeat protein